MYHNDLPRDLVEHCAAENIRFTDERLNLQTIAGEADCALLNGTHTTTVQLLLRGVPYILAPRHPEQLLFSERVANTGAGLIVNHRDPKQLVTGISEFTSKERYRNRAKNIASRYAGHDQRALDAQLYAEIERLIERNQSVQ